jgi:hypothetical protein
MAGVRAPAAKAAVSRSAGGECRETETRAGSVEVSYGDAFGASFMIRLSLAGATALVLAVGAVQAQPRRLAACQSDLQTLCAGIQPGGGRIAQCLKAHADQVSQGCKTALAERRAARRDQRTEQGQGGEAAPASPPPSSGGQ